MESEFFVGNFFGHEERCCQVPISVAPLLRIGGRLSNERQAVVLLGLNCTILKKDNVQLPSVQIVAGYNSEFGAEKHRWKKKFKSNQQFWNVALIFRSHFEWFELRKQAKLFYWNYIFATGLA